MAQYLKKFSKFVAHLNGSKCKIKFGVYYLMYIFAKNFDLSY